MSRIRGMRGYLASSIAVTCAAALAFPLALSTDAAAKPPAAKSPTTERAATDGQPSERSARARPATARTSVKGAKGAKGATAAGMVAAAAAAGAAPGRRATTGPVTAPSATDRSIPGSTQSLPLKPLGPLAPPTPVTPPPTSGDRILPPASVLDSASASASAQGLPRRDVRHFSLVGVVWDNPDTELHGRVQVRTRAAGSAKWSAWQDVDTHNHEHAADPDTAERTSGRVRGSTAPLWVGASDGVEVRVQAEADGRAGVDGRAVSGDPLPRGLHVELIDPGVDPAAEPPPQGSGQETPRVNVLTPESAASSAVNADLAPLGATEIPALSRKQTQADLLATRGESADPGSATDTPGATGTAGSTGTGNTADAVDPADTSGAAAVPGAKPYVGARPRIVTRRGWGADETLRERNFAYTKTVKSAFVHHSASGNNYRCAQAPSVIRSIYRYHVKSSGWRDIGYNFLIDKCGNIYEGRAGGVAKAVMGAHTLGFNTNSMGIAVLGSFGATNPPAVAVTAIAKLTAWKLGLFGANPKGKTYLKSGGGNLYRKGKNVRLNVISGHRDGFATECPGGRLYAKLGSARAASARHQGR
ncbi:N-acetylmuramoyl-L-alanine amidase [Streptomyces sp. NBC_00878]|uniref:N-acetylmuramoyl-L-alanine amidase n=1 Tax=Streptomyces sp. NBC_00878 TaxID=2975854 RepID=UPI00224EFD86|nr:N-acetylmuramoyl-L-alanine amidase [Streptomyces sp. NBC_00878]MCX4908210.1 N-acetylmuramoyl-L-alanine amidase [Streptomyces sp. NBC_00878]